MHVPPENEQPAFQRRPFSSYPRTRGAFCSRGALPKAILGKPPHARGKLQLQRRRRRDGGKTPALTGQEVALVRGVTLCRITPAHAGQDPSFSIPHDGNISISPSPKLTRAQLVAGMCG